MTTVPKALIAQESERACVHACVYACASLFFIYLENQGRGEHMKGLFFIVLLARVDQLG